MPKNIDKEPAPASSTLEDPAMAHDKPETPPIMSSGGEEFQADEEPGEKELLRKFLPGKHCNKITFAEFMHAAHEFGANTVEATVDDLRAYFAHLSFICKMEATCKYDQQMHLNYDKAVRIQAEEMGWSAFKTGNTTLASLYYGIENGIPKENEEDLIEPDLELGSDGHEIDVETACSTSKLLVHQSMDVSHYADTVRNQPHWQSVANVSTDPAILQYRQEDNGIAQVPHDKDNMHLTQSLDMTLVTEAMETKSTVSNELQCQSVTTVSTDPAILQYRKEDIGMAQGTLNIDHLPQSLDMTLVTEAMGRKGTMTPGSKRRMAHRPGSRKATAVIKDGVSSNHSAITKRPKASVTQKRHTCLYCPERFSCPSKLKIHVKTHTREKHHMCSNCSKVFTSAKDLSDHMDDHAEEARAKQHHCSNCGKEFKKHSDLTIHMRHHTGERPYSCTQCGNKFISSDGLKWHMVRHTGSKQYICSYCGKQFYTSSALTVHTTVHTGEKPHICSYCEMRFGTRAGLTSHIRCHTGEKCYKCSQCGKAFSDSGNLARHKFIHTEERPYKCQYCAWGFKQSDHLKRHIKTCHTGEKATGRRTTIPDKTHICSDCGKQYRYLSSLKVHMITHTGGNPLTCPDCGKLCTSDAGLRYHMMDHTGELPLECSHCGKGFSSSVLLNAHKNTHTGEKPYVCSDCGKAFSSESNLRRHKRTHTGEKPYVCSYCGKGFSEKCNLQLHEMIHTGEKPFVCSECGKGFSRAVDLRKHMKVHG